MAEPQPSFVNSIHELIAGFLGNKFYNVLYNIAKHNQSKSRDTVTNIYLLLLSKMESTIDTHVVFGAEVRELHEFIRHRAKKLDGTFATFQHNLLSGFVPGVYLASMTDGDKDQIFNTITLSCYKNTIRMLRRPESLKVVIDDRQNGIIHCRKLQDSIIGLLRSYRDDLYTKFAKQENKDKDAINNLATEVKVLTGEIGRRDAIITAMQTKIAEQREVAEQLEAEIADSRKIAGGAGNLQAENRNLQVENRNLQAENRNFQAENRSLRAEINTLQAELARKTNDTGLREELAKKDAQIAELEDKLSRAAVPIADDTANLFPAGGQGESANTTAADDGSDGSDDDEWEAKLRARQNALFGL